MEKSRLLQLLRTFDSAEIRGFRKFVRSPYFNQREDVPELFEYLSKFLKNGRPVPEKTVVFSHLFPNEKFDDHRIRLLMSFLFRLAGQFLSIRKLMGGDIAYQYNLAVVYRERKLGPHFEKTWEELNNLQENRTVRNANFYEENYQISLEKYRSDSSRRQLDVGYLQSLEKQLDLAYFSRKLWQACFLLSHQAMRNIDFDFGMLPKILSYIKQKELLDIPAISIYYYCYRALTEPDKESYFQKFKSQIFLFNESFPTEELRDLHILAINFCIRQYNAGTDLYLREQFELYRNGFEHGYFLVEGTLSHITYQNAVTSGLVMEEFAWVENFMLNYRDKLGETYQESVFSFNRARLEYERNHLSAALELLQKAEYGDLLLNLAARSLQMKIYYELGEFDLLDSHLQAFKTFLRRKKELGYHRENYLNTIRFTRKLLEINPFDKEEKLELRRELELTKAVGEKDWLLMQF